MSGASSNNGGSAFPGTSEFLVPGIAGVSSSQKVLRHEPGMSLRDYIAAHAMHAELTTCGVPGPAANALVDALGDDESIEDHIARLAYAMADAMLRARAEC